MPTLALWFELDEVSAHRFSDAIDALSERFSTPRFLPHITVFNGLSLDQTPAIAFVDGLVQDSNDVTVDFTDIGYDDMWSRSLHVRVVPSERMCEIHDRVANWLGVPGPLYSPYLSLLYGEFAKHQKMRAVEDMQLHLPERANIAAVSLWHTDPTSVSMWKRLQRIPIPITDPESSTV